MIRFIIKLFTIIAIFAGLNLATMMIPIEQQRMTYLGAYTDKMDTLINHEAGSIIIVGGSYSVFGIDPNILSMKLDRPVVHIGLHAGVNLRFMLNSIKSYIREGDTILLFLEYPYYFNPPNRSSSDTMRRLISIDPENTLPYIATLGEWYNIIIYHPEFTLNSLWNQYISKVDIRAICNSYCYHSISPDGDLYGEFQQQDRESLEHILEVIQTTNPNKAISPEGIHNNVPLLINSFNSTVEARGAKVYIIYPPLPQTIIDRSHDNIELLISQIEQQVDVPILNKPYSIPDFLYFDTIYHLTSSWCETRK